MCFTMGMSFFLASSSFAVAIHEYRQFKSPHYSLAIGYSGLMEFLQGIQHIYAAGPEDDYAMCKHPINQNLTDLGMVHIMFQPLFICYCFMAMYRRVDIQARAEADLIVKLCIVMALWFPLHPWMCALTGAAQHAAEYTPDCPNYMWLNEGYDGFLGKSTPNIPGVACTFYPETKSGHLAWAVPMYKPTYFRPSGSIHLFMMFVPYLVMFRRPFLQISAILLIFTGAYWASVITPSVNEQPAIWCFGSVVQILLFAFVTRLKELHKLPIPDKIYHPGAWGEVSLTYVRYTDDDNADPKASIPLLPSEEEKAA